MKKQPCPANLLLDLEARQEEVIARLDDLDRKIEKVLAEYLALQASEASAESAGQPPEEVVFSIQGRLRKAG